MCYTKLITYLFTVFIEETDSKIKIHYSHFSDLKINLHLWLVFYYTHDKNRYFSD